jgi:YidC/Oxa1 family membrane protein insertase
VRERAGRPRDVERLAARHDVDRDRPRGVRPHGGGEPAAQEHRAEQRRAGGRDGDARGGRAGADRGECGQRGDVRRRDGTARPREPEDRERQNLEMMKLYQEGGVNPLGGCLPLVLQLPIWAALFTTLRTSYELYGMPFWGVWSNLTAKDPTYLLPLALGITMIVTQRLQPQMMDKQQAFLMTWVMPVFFTGLMMNYPAGLALYIFTNNLLSIVQQFALRKYLERSKAAEARA